MSQHTGASNAGYDNISDSIKRVIDKLKKVPDGVEASAVKSAITFLKDNTDNIVDVENTNDPKFPTFRILKFKIEGKKKTNWFLILNKKTNDNGKSQYMISFPDEAERFKGTGKAFQTNLKDDGWCHFSTVFEARAKETFPPKKSKPLHAYIYTCLNITLYIKT